MKTSKPRQRPWSLSPITLRRLMPAVALSGLVVWTAAPQGRNVTPPWAYPRVWGPPLRILPPIPAPGLDARMIKPAPVGIDERIIAVAPEGIDERFIVTPRFQVR